MVNPNEISDELINPPTFHLPDDFLSNRNQYELWACRVPVKLDLSVLSGTSFHLMSEDSTLPHNNARSKNDDDTSGIHEPKPIATHVIAKFPIEGRTYGLLSSNSLEFDTYRMLVKDEKSIKEMKALIPPFDKLINFVDLTPTEVSEVDVAPSKTRGVSMNDDKHQLKIPYEPVEQIKGLKRRWNMYGAAVSLHESTIWKQTNEEKLKANTTPRDKKRRKQYSMSQEELSPSKHEKGFVEEINNTGSPKKDKKHKKRKSKE